MANIWGMTPPFIGVISCAKSHLNGSNFDFICFVDISIDEPKKVAKKCYKPPKTTEIFTKMAVSVTIKSLQSLH